MVEGIKRILCVDDDADILQLERFALERTGEIEVFTFANGKKALAQVEEIKPDIIVLDAMMPGLDGLRLLEALRRLPAVSNTPVIFTSAKVQVDEIKRYIDAGAIGVIPKPFEPMRLMQKIQTMWKLHHHLPLSVKSAVVLESLRQEYLAQLPVYQQQLSHFLTHYQQGTASPAEYQQLAQLIHKLKGSGATYGFADISQAATEIQTELEDKLVADFTQLTTSLSQLIDVCKNILQKQPGVTTRTIPQKSETAPIILQNVHLLLVEENSELLRLLGHRLEENTIILTADNQEEACRIITSCCPDLIVVVETGAISASQIWHALQTRKALADIPMLIVTDQCSDDVVNYAESPAVDYICRPFTAKTVLERIRFKLKHRYTLVMIADDDKTVRELMAHKFSVAGYQVLVAEDGQEAWNLAVTKHPDLIILDRMMPGLDGLALLQKLRQNPSTEAIPVLFLTAKRQEEDILNGFKFGTTDYVIKPFSPEEVFARSLRCLNNR